MYTQVRTALIVTLCLLPAATGSSQTVGDLDVLAADLERTVIELDSRDHQQVYEELRTIFERARQLGATEIEGDVHFYLGLTRQLQAADTDEANQKRLLLEDAASFYRSALELRPEHAAILNNFARAQADLGRHQEAETLYEKTVSLPSARLPFYLSNFAKFLVKRGSPEDLEEAERLYRQALVADPYNLEAHRGLYELLTEHRSEGLPDYVAFLIDRGRVLWAKEIALERLASSGTAEDRQTYLALLAVCLSKLESARESFAGSDDETALQDLLDDPVVGAGASELIQLFEGVDPRPESYRWWGEHGEPPDLEGALPSPRQAFRRLLRSFADTSRAAGDVEPALDYLRAAVELTDEEPDLLSFARLVGPLNDLGRQNEIDALRSRYDELLSNPEPSRVVPEPPALDAYRRAVGAAYCDRPGVNSARICIEHLRPLATVPESLNFDPEVAQQLAQAYERVGQISLATTLKRQQAQWFRQQGRKIKAQDIEATIPRPVAEPERYPPKPQFSVPETRRAPIPAETNSSLPSGLLGSSGSIAVKVVDANGGPLPGVIVEANSNQSLTQRSAATNGEGQATLRSLSPANNYTVSARLEGFGSVERINVPVGVGQVTRINLVITPDLEETITVTVEEPLIDTTRSSTTTSVPVDLINTLPIVSRDFRDFAQLAPGISPTIDSRPSNASSITPSGDAASSNNYFLEGIDVTDSVTGFASAGLNTQIIQEQTVTTTAVTAEYSGGGLVSNVVTKSGGNDFSGSLEIYVQASDLEAGDQQDPNASLELVDVAATLGGPIKKDKAWFFLGYRVLDERANLGTPDTGEFLRRVSEDSEQPFAKLSLAPTSSDLVTLSFLADDTDSSGSTDNLRSNRRDFGRLADNAGWSLTYSRVFSNLAIDATAADYRREVHDRPTIDAVRNDVIFRGSDPRTQSEEQAGGEGSNSDLRLGNRSARFSAEYFLATSWGAHSIKGGIDLIENNHRRSLQLVDSAAYFSLSNNYSGSGLSAREVAEEFSQVEFDPRNPGHRQGLLESIADHPDRTALLSLLDSDRDGIVSEEELSTQLIFDSTELNPFGQINYSRRIQRQAGTQETSLDNVAIYLQDGWQWDRWSANVGVRGGRRTLEAADDRVLTLDWVLAPRIAVTFNVARDGSQRLSAFYGRYQDPIRSEVLGFASPGLIFDDQVFVGGNWLTYRTRGDEEQRDGFFAPNTKAALTDEYLLSYAVDLGKNRSLELNLIKRRTRNILEDYNLDLYTDASVYPGNIDHPDSLFLGLDAFGFSERPGADYVLTHLAGGLRDWESADLVFKKKYSDQWQLLASYQYARATSNTDSDTSSGLQGDVLFLDPRAPNRDGIQRDLVEHSVKISGNHNWDHGFSVGGTFSWSSGAALSSSRRFSGDDVPLRVAPSGAFEFAGIVDRWLAPDAVGDLETPAVATLDLRLGYLLNLGSTVDLDLYLDIFNVFDDQDAFRIQSLISGLNGVDYLEGTQFVDPRRIVLGVRLSF